MPETIADPAALRAHYGSVSRPAALKQLSRLDRHCRAFIARSPFLVMATADAEGRCDASPKGDAPGFVVVQDETTLLIPDRVGNNRVDSLQNLVANPQVGLLFFLPGYQETLRVNGRARISTDAAHLEATAHAGKPPKAVIVVTVEEAYMHCGKALIRSHLWDPARHIAKGDFPTLGRIIADQIREADVAGTERMIADNYRDELY
jgi:PPOX class probable FMN-dependent enzyme